jgi:hypothetical protein
VEYHSAELGQLKANENKQNHVPDEKIGHDYALAAAIEHEPPRRRAAGYLCKHCNYLRGSIG